MIAISGQNVAVFILMAWAILTIVCLLGAATDQDRPRFPDKVRERWWD